jgi:hypothetical protein
MTRQVGPYAILVQVRLLVRAQETGSRDQCSSINYENNTRGVHGRCGHLGCSIVSSSKNTRGPDSGMKADTTVPPRDTAVFPDHIATFLSVCAFRSIQLFLNRTFAINVASVLADIYKLGYSRKSRLSTTSQK